MTESTVMDRYEGIEANIKAVAKMGRWSRRVMYVPPIDDDSDCGCIRVRDRRTGQVVEVVADRSGLWLSVRDVGRCVTTAARRPVRQGDVVRAARRAVEIWRAGGRIEDGNRFFSLDERIVTVGEN